MRRFPRTIRNVFASINDRQVSVWLDLKSVTDPVHSFELQESTRKFVEHFGMELVDFVNLSEVNLPSETACLGIIRRKSPISIHGFARELRKRGFVFPNQQWLNHRLDLLRKKDFIFRQRSGYYVMTLNGLKVMGSGKNRRSPDVRRALTMARSIH